MGTICRVYVRDLPRNLACLTNTVISIIRGLPQFQYLPEANRHFGPALRRPSTACYKHPGASSATARPSCPAPLL